MGLHSSTLPSLSSAIGQGDADALQTEDMQIILD